MAVDVTITFRLLNVMDLLEAKTFAEEHGWLDVQSGEIEVVKVTIDNRPE